MGSSCSCSFAFVALGVHGFGSATLTLDRGVRMIYDLRLEV